MPHRPPRLLFAGFQSERVDADGVAINLVRGGSGPPVLMLHGYPQTHAIWHRVASVLAERLTVVCADLRGYGDSAKPPGDPEHASYAKRAMARDQLDAMRALGFERFAVVGHDRGARVARRLALDHPEAVSRLAVLDIVPTRTVYATLDRSRATTVWRYFFLIQPPPLPERLIASEQDLYLDSTIADWCGTAGVPEDAAMAEYRRCFDRATIHASCEDYRAGATIDLAHDDTDAGASLRCPVLVLWSEGGIGAAYDVLEIWSEGAPDVAGRALDCGHFLAEERPDEVASE